jgi:FeS assembly SUF system protein
MAENENQTNSINALVIETQVIEALRGVFDPEIPVNIYEMGLIYEVKVELSGAVAIRMTLTSPSCPAAQSLPGEVEARVKEIPGVTGVALDVVWEPPWDPSRMSEAARLQLGML